MICEPYKITEKGCKGAPDWIVEIVSTGSRYMDYMRKLVKYEAAGVREYWVVDPEKEIVMVYDFKKDISRTNSFHEDNPVGLYGGFHKG